MGTLDNRHTIALPYWARPGFMLATSDEDGGDNPELDDEDEDEEDSDDDEDEDEDGDKSLDDLKAELKNTRDALKRAAGQSKKRRVALQKARKDAADALAKRTTKPPKKDEDDDDKLDVNAIREQIRNEAKAEADTRAKKSAIRSELRAAGIPKERISRLAGMIDLEDLDVLDDDDIDGLDDAIDGLKSDYPELFPSGRRKRPGNTGPKDDADDRKKKLTPSEAQAKALTGR